MFKTSIVVAVKDGKAEAQFFDSPQRAKDAYQEEKGDESNEFVGLLRKPVWYNRSSPANAAKQAAAQAVRDKQTAAQAAAASAQLKLEDAERGISSAEIMRDPRVLEVLGVVKDEIVESKKGADAKVQELVDAGEPKPAKKKAPKKKAAKKVDEAPPVED